MRTTIDGAGRVVIPKPMRDELGMTGGSELELSVVDRRIEIDVPSTPMRLDEHGGGVVAVTDRQMPTLTAEAVRDTLDRVRR